MEQLVLDLGMAPRATLARFVVGANAAALAHLQVLCRADAAPAVPSYLWGASGAGKTHLLTAVAAELDRRGRAVAWLDSRGVIGEAAFDSAWDAVLMDDVHLYDARRQHVAFNWFINAFAPPDGRPRLVLAAGALPPADLPLRADLRTRLGWGQVYELHLLTDSERAAALQQAAAARGLRLPAEVTRYLLTHFARDLGSLMALLDRLDRYALQTQRGITVPLLKHMLQEQAGASQEPAC